MKTSALRRWLREERGRENAEALAAGVDIAPTAAEPLHLEGLTSIDLGTPWPSLRPGHRLIDTWPACTVSNLPDHPLTAEHLGHAVRDLEAMARGEAAYRPLAYFGLEARPPTFLPRVCLDDDHLQRVLRVKVHPVLEAMVAENFNADLVVIDASMPADRIEVTPLAYAEHIECTIGFSNPDDPKT